MRQPCPTVRAVLYAGFVVWYSGCGGGQKMARTDPAPSAAAPVARVTPAEPADNSYCYVCHANYRKEALTTIHQPMRDKGYQAARMLHRRLSGEGDGVLTLQLPVRLVERDSA